MPASLRAHVSRGMASSSRPYDRRSPTASPAQSTNSSVHPDLSQSLPPISPSPVQQDSGPGSESDTPPDHPGLPTYTDYKQIEAEYLRSLSPRKRDKALITQAMFDKIWDVLHQPEACTIETPQFRFWVRKMFSLSRPMWVGVRGDGSWSEVRVGGGDGAYADHPESDAEGEEMELELERALGIGVDKTADLFSAVVLHENRPVAIVEQLYELFCYCHVHAGHGGRDKTCAVIRQHYSWVPKELTAQFVKACPTCALKRNGHGGVGAGVLMQGRAVGQRERRAHVTPSGAGEMPVPVSAVVPSSLGNVVWPTTGGPLDPANPEPCGVRERGRERAWLRAREDSTGTIGPPCLPTSPAPVFADARTRSASSEVTLEDDLPDRWNAVPVAMAVDAPPPRLCDTTNTNFPKPFGAHENDKTRTHRGGKRNATRRKGPPSLDENANLTGTGHRPDATGECLPSVLRPLRASGSISCEAEPDLPPPAAECYAMQIDPALLSFDYPGLRLSDSCSASSGVVDAATAPFALGILSGGAAGGRHHGGLSDRARATVENMNTNMNCSNGKNDDRHSTSTVAAGTRERSATMGSVDPSVQQGANTGRVSRDAATVACTTTTAATLVCGRRSARRRCGSRHGYGSSSGYRDGSLAGLCHYCAVDGAVHDLDGTLSLSVGTDA